MGRRVLLVGRVTDPAGRRTAFPELRTDAFRVALEAAGHEVRVAGLVPADEADGRAPSGWAGTARVAEEGPGWLQALAALAEGAEVVVGAGPHNASRAACLVAGERPVWADVPGDPFAEVQAAALAGAAPLPDRQAAAAAALLPVLARADRLGAVSDRQRLLLLGQLGLVGRLASPAAADLVDVVPVSFHFDLPARASPARQPDQPLRVALVGGANAWLDVPTLVAGLDAARERVAGLSVLLAGGPVPGHHDEGWQALSAWARQRSWVEVEERPPPDRLALLLARCHVGVVLDRPGLEPETGSRTRVLFLLHQGLEVVCTTRTELCAELATEELVWAVPPGSAVAVAEALAAVAAAPGDPRASRAGAFLAARYGPATSIAPVVAFATAPRRTPAVAHPMADLARQHAHLRDELARVHDTPTWRLLSRLHGALKHR